MRRLQAVAASTLVIAGCGGSSEGTPPAGADEVVLRVVSQGGFAADSRNRRSSHGSACTGAGRVIILGPTTLEFPGPALPNVQEFGLTRDGLTRVVDDARDAGLLDDPPPDYGDPGITDQRTTTVTVRLDGRTRTVDVYALNFSDGVTAAQRENRELLTNFIELAGDPGALLPVVVPRQHATLRRSCDRSAHSPVGRNRRRRARLATRRPAETDCLVLGGSEAGTALDAARTAHEGDVWESAGATYNVAFRPLLPDERTCADLSPNR